MTFQWTHANAIVHVFFLRVFFFSTQPTAGLHARRRGKWPDGCYVTTPRLLYSLMFIIVLWFHHVILYVFASLSIITTQCTSVKLGRQSRRDESLRQRWPARAALARCQHRLAPGLWRKSRCDESQHRWSSGAGRLGPLPTPPVPCLMPGPEVNLVSIITCRILIGLIACLMAYCAMIG